MYLCDCLYLTYIYAEMAFVLVRQNGEKIAEIYRDGLWWPICADGFPKDQLSNVCKEIGMGFVISTVQTNPILFLHHHMNT